MKEVFTPNKKHVLSNARTKTVLTVFLSIFSLIMARTLWLQILSPPGKNLSYFKKRSYNRNSNDISYRGTIFDHKKKPLAISIKAPSLAINPQIFKPTKTQIKKLSKILGISKRKIRQLQKKKSYFAWLKRKATHEEADKIKALKIRGISHRIEPARFYPGKTSASQLIGLVGTDNIGLFGLEKLLDEQLAGTIQKITKLKDARGFSILTNSGAVKPHKAGNHVVLTLDKVIQGITEEALKKGFKKSQAKSAFAIVADPHTGRIFAMANQPEFDPNKTSELIMQHTKNRSIRSLIEPGSVLKPLVIANALDLGVTSISQPHNCEISGAYKIGENAAIHDEHPREYLTTAEVLIYSSNICTFKIAQKIGRKATYEILKKFGLATPSKSILLPHSKTGFISSWKDWLEIRFANISFGQGLFTTGLEVIKAYSILANGGFSVEPYILERIETPEKDIIISHKTYAEKKVLSRKTSKLIREILYRSVEEGTGKNARLKSYLSAGKTGTTEKYSNKEKQYSKEKRIASFAGFAPAFDPHLVAYIVIDEPQKKPYYGGKWAAPIFRDIMEQALKYLNVASQKKQKPLKINLSSQNHHDLQNKAKL